MSRGDKGFTLIEMLIAMFILLVGMLALLNTVATSLSANMENVLRDEAVRIAEEGMNELKSMPFDSLASSSATITREFRGISKSYGVGRTVGVLSTDTRNLTVTVTWSHRNVDSQHSINSVVVR